MSTKNKFFIKQEQTLKELQFIRLLDGKLVKVVGRNTQLGLMRVIETTSSTIENRYIEEVDVESSKMIDQRMMEIKCIESEWRDDPQTLVYADVDKEFNCMPRNIKDILGTNEVIEAPRSNLGYPFNRSKV